MTKRRCLNDLPIVIQRSPEIPGRNRTVRSPFLPKLHKLFRRREFSPAKGFGETFANTVIIDWPDIRAAEIEKKKHLNCPLANPADLCEARDDFIVVHL